MRAAVLDPLVGVALLAVLALGGCVNAAGTGGGPPDARRYTIDLQRPNQVATGPTFRGILAAPSTEASLGSLVYGERSSAAEVQAVIEGNPGLREALIENGVDLSTITALRVEPTGVVKVYRRGIGAEAD